MKKMNVAINGFGRIGRAALKIIIEEFPNLKPVAVNDLADNKTLAHLLRYDSVYGKAPFEIKEKEDCIYIKGKKIEFLTEKDPANLPWKKMKVDVVLECTGIFKTKDALKAHIEAGAKKVVLSAPAKGKGVKMIVPGVNMKNVKKSDDIISCASCTTNCLSPVTKVIKESFGIKKALMTTIHAYTASQNLVDGNHKDLRRARAAAVNMVPTTTGAAVATTEAFPSLKGIFDGMAVRVPIPVGSMCDTVFLLKKNVTEDSLKKAFTKASNGKLKGILKASNEPLVSSDIVGDPHSSIVDLEMTKVAGGNLVKIIAWYDNEWGYSNRLVELVANMSKFVK
ncbi:MAG: type I glyceraldehyde-3-phosphate dehydrogenase [Patescibacteria group bacterium]|jgi:glyceraldehyde 3-phosphate dehydrogenase|nr:type I glyceraldehyde-3-phosphate dehydrogenase [Patescibacteria group bacterium]